MVYYDLTGCIASVLLILFFHNSSGLLWLASITYGLSVASIYASAINWTEEHIQVNGKILSILTVAASTGDAVIPLIMGLSISSPMGPVAMMLIVLSVAVSALAIFALLTSYIAPKYGVVVKDKKTNSQKKSEMKRKERKKKIKVTQQQPSTHTDTTQIDISPEDSAITGTYAAATATLQPTATTTTDVAVAASAFASTTSS